MNGNIFIDINKILNLLDNMDDLKLYINEKNIE